MDGSSLRDWCRVLLYFFLASYLVLQWLHLRLFMRPVHLPAGLPYSEVVDRLAHGIKTAYPYLEDKRIDWPAARARALRAVADAKDESGLARVLAALVGELDDPHAAVVSPTLLEQFGWHPGLALRPIGDRLYVERAPAVGAPGGRLAPGSEVLMIDGHPLGKAPLGSRVESLLLPGRRESVVRLRCRDPEGQESEVELTRAYSILEDTPRYPTSRMLQDSVGYVAIPHFVGARPWFLPRALVPHAPRYRGRLTQALGALRSARALVIDLRGNRGGELLTARVAAARVLPDRRLAGWFADDRGRKRRSVWFHGFSEAFLGPLVLLVDRATASAAEVFTYVLRQTRARTWVVGRPTAAALGSPTCRYRYRSLRVFFPGLAFADRQGRRQLGLSGITPDRAASWTAEDLRLGRDPDVEEALAFLRLEGAR